jgi:hypothetical protein
MIVIIELFKEPSFSNKSMGLGNALTSSSLPGAGLVSSSIISRVKMSESLREKLELTLDGILVQLRETNDKEVCLRHSEV